MDKIEKKVEKNQCRLAGFPITGSLEKRDKKFNNKSFVPPKNHVSISERSRNMVQGILTVASKVASMLSKGQTSAQKLTTRCEFQL
jgi:hypothetical protein